VENLSGFRTIRPLPLTLGISLALSSVSFIPEVLAAPATATITQQTRYDLPADTLQQTLSRISQQSGATIELRLTDISAYRSPAISGNLSAAQALAAALAATPLRSSLAANGHLVVEAPAAVASNPVDTDAAVLPAIDVQSTADDDYTASESSSALRTSTALQETPQSVKSITHKVIADRQATSVEDALRNAAGVVDQKGNRGNSVYFIRGYEVTQTSTDGVTTPETRNGLVIPSTPIDGVEGLEVIKGPAAVMSGSSSPGGTINIIRKAPVTDPLHVIRGEVTDRGEYKTAIDLGGALSDDKAWSYRLNVARTRSSETYPDYNGSRADFVAPVIAWKGDSTRIKVGAEFSDTRTAQGLAGTYYDTTLQKIRKLSTYRMGDKDDHISGVSKTGYYELSQDLVDGWTFNSKATYGDTKMSFKINEPYAILPDGQQIAHQFSSVDTTRYWSTQNDVRGTFNTGPVKQEVLLGVDYMHSNNTQYEFADGAINVDGNVLDKSSLDYPHIPTARDKSYDSRNIQRGLIIQDQITILEKLHLLFAGKESVWENQNNIVGSGSSSFRQTKWVPNYGIAYDLTPEITAYANLMHGFSGSYNIDRFGNALAPSSSKSKEVGLKFSLLDDRFTITTALFDIEQTNVPLSDQTGQYIGSEGRRSKGFDLDLNGEILPGWNLTASYTYSKFSDPSEVNGQANKVTGQPKNSANIWTSYELQTGRLKGLGAGIGVTAASDMVSGYRTSTYYDVSGYAQTDLSVFYHQKDWSLNLGVKNLFDRDIYSYSTATTWMGVKDGRTARLTAEYRF